MSFLKKLTKEFEELKATFADKDTKEEKPAAQDHSKDPSYQPTQQSYGGPAPYSQPSGYGAPSPSPYNQQYSQNPSYPTQQQSYIHPPQVNHQPSYGSSSPFPAPPNATPPLPPGWISQWDSQSNRNFYIEQATGRTQWDPPAYTPYPPPTIPGGSDDRNMATSSGYHSGYSSGHGMPPSSHGASNAGFYNERGEWVSNNSAGHYAFDRTHEHTKETKKDKDKKKNKDKSSSNVILAGAGGLAAGAVGGALLGHALADDSSDDEHGHTAVPMAAPPPIAPGYYQDPAYAAGPPPLAPPLPDETASGSSVSSSDRESVEEAREEYQEALASGSSSDVEEAREEYEEEYEETYED